MWPRKSKQTKASQSSNSTSKGRFQTIKLANKLHKSRHKQSKKIQPSPSLHPSRSTRQARRCTRISLPHRQVVSLQDLKVQVSAALISTVIGLDLQASHQVAACMAIIWTVGEGTVPEETEHTVILALRADTVASASDPSHHLKAQWEWDWTAANQFRPNSTGDSHLRQTNSSQPTILKGQRATILKCRNSGIKTLTDLGQAFKIFSAICRGWKPIGESSSCEIRERARWTMTCRHSSRCRWLVMSSTTC